MEALRQAHGHLIMGQIAVARNTVLDLEELDQSDPEVAASTAEAKAHLRHLLSFELRDPKKRVAVPSKHLIATGTKTLVLVDAADAGDQFRTVFRAAALRMGLLRPGVLAKVVLMSGDGLVEPEGWRGDWRAVRDNEIQGLLQWVRTPPITPYTSEQASMVNAVRHALSLKPDLVFVISSRVAQSPEREQTVVLFQQYNPQHDKEYLYTQAVNPDKKSMARQIARLGARPFFFMPALKPTAAEDTNGLLRHKARTDWYEAPHRFNKKLSEDAQHYAKLALEALDKAETEARERRDQAELDRIHAAQELARHYFQEKL